MFCQKCGAQVPDGFAFCSQCGSQVTAAQPQPVYQAQPVYQQPQYAYPPQPPVQPRYQAVTPKKKKEFLREEAPAGCRRNSLITTIVSIVCILLMVAGVVSALVQPFYEVPAMNFVLDLADADADDLMEELEEEYEDAKVEYELTRDSYVLGEQQALDLMLEAIEKMVDSFSVANMLGAVSMVEEAAQYAPHLLDEDISDDAEIIRQALVAVIVVLAALYLLPLLFTLLGGMKKSSGLTIAGLVLVLLPQLCLGGGLLTLASLVLGIVQVVLCGRINREYDRYRNKCLNGC